MARLHAASYPPQAYVRLRARHASGRPCVFPLLTPAPQSHLPLAVRWLSTVFGAMSHSLASVDRHSPVLRCRIRSLAPVRPMVVRGPRAVAMRYRARRSACLNTHLLISTTHPLLPSTVLNNQALLDVPMHSPVRRCPRTIRSQTARHPSAHPTARHLNVMRCCPRSVLCRQIQLLL